MKVLLDENLPHDLRHFIAGHEVYTVAYQGWAGTGNGELLEKAAAAGFGAMISMDAGIEREYAGAPLPIAVVLLTARSNTLDDRRPLVPSLLKTLSSLVPRSVVRVS